MEELEKLPKVLRDEHGQVHCLDIVWSSRHDRWIVQYINAYNDTMIKEDKLIMVSHHILPNAIKEMAGIIHVLQVRI